MKILIDCDYIVYKCCAAAETEMDFGDDVIVVTSNFSDAMKCVQRDLDRIQSDLGSFDDELQYETPEEDATNLMNLLEKAAELAGEYYDLRCPIAAEAKQGKTWADVH